MKETTPTATFREAALNLNSVVKALLAKIDNGVVMYDPRIECSGIVEIKSDLTAIREASFELDRALKRW